MNSRLAVQLTAETLKETQDKVMKIVKAQSAELQQDGMSLVFKWVFCMGYSWSPTVNDLLTYISQLNATFQPAVDASQLKSIRFDIFFHFEDKSLEAEFVKENTARLNDALPGQWMFIEQLREMAEWKEAEETFNDLLDKATPHGVEILKNIEADVAKWQKHQRAKAAEKRKNLSVSDTKPLPDIAHLPHGAHVVPASSLVLSSKTAELVSAPSVQETVTPEETLRMYYKTVGADRICLMPKKGSRDIHVIFASQASNDPLDPTVNHHERVGVWTMVSKYAHLTDRARELTYLNDFSIQEKLTLDLAVAPNEPLTDAELEKLYLFVQKLFSLKNDQQDITPEMVEKMLCALVYCSTQNFDASMVDPVGIKDMARVGLRQFGYDAFANRIQEISSFASRRNHHATVQTSSAYAAMFSPVGRRPMEDVILLSGKTTFVSDHVSSNTLS